MAESKAVIWQGATEILKQIEEIREKSENPGIVFYSASSFSKIGPALTDSLKHSSNKYFAFPPTMPWLDNKAPEAPELKGERKNGTMHLEWTIIGKKQDNVTYAVYRFGKNQSIDLDKSEHIIAVVKGNSYVDKDVFQNGKDVYVVTALDRLWNESDASNVIAE
jgi:hypothetical protein